MKFVRGILRRIRDSYRYLFVSRIAANKLNHLAAKCSGDVQCLVDLAFSFEYKQWFSSVTIKPGQVKEEITKLCRLIQEVKPATIAEIGTCKGGTLFLFTRIANSKLTISVDLPSGSFGGGYPSWIIPLYKSLSKNSAIHLIRADSHSGETLKKFKALLGNSKIDFLFIDGDHTYEGVKQDFLMYSPFVREGGIIAFHDIVKHDHAEGCEVDRFWREIKLNYRYVEIVQDWTQKWAGIGVIYF
jgi:predicted O-methyltransferase YrrM